MPKAHEDENGIEGVIVDREDTGKKKVFKGVRMSSDHIKRMDYDTKEDEKEAHKKMASQVHDIATNTKEPPI